METSDWKKNCIVHWSMLALRMLCNAPSETIQSKGLCSLEERAGSQLHLPMPTQAQTTKSFTDVHFALQILSLQTMALHFFLGLQFVWLFSSLIHRAICLNGKRYLTSEWGWYPKTDVKPDHMSMIWFFLVCFKYKWELFFAASAAPLICGFLARPMLKQPTWTIIKYVKYLSDG